ncbi:ATP-grasp domain-containing protein, partial [Patescibacteria group bacterium]|nr:ATP-grasp domain-containing protein [Patescibacteria group bacterium]
NTSINSAKYIQSKITFAESETFLYPEEFDNFLERSNNFDLVVPAIHGHPAEDGYLQSILDQRNIKYIFSNSSVSKLCFHKENAKTKVSEIGYRVPRTYLFDDDINFPIIVKPQENGSSFGVFLVTTKDELGQLSLESGEYLFEEYIEGRELVVGVIENDNGIHALPVMEAKKSGAIFSEEEKTTELSKNIEIFPDILDLDLENKLKNTACDIHQQIGLHHLSRTDFIVTNQGEIYFIEINTIPGCSENSFIPKMLEKQKINFSDLLQEWIKKELT